MKIVRFIGLVLLIAVSHGLKAQFIVTSDNGSYRNGRDNFYKVIYIQKNMNTYVKFSGAKLKSIDVGGSPTDLIWSVQGTDLIKFKALKANFPATNMLVQTKDTLVQFKIVYGVAPNMVNVDLSFGGRYHLEDEISTPKNDKRDSLIHRVSNRPISEAEILLEDAENPSAYLGDFVPTSFHNARTAKKNNVRQRYSTDGQFVFGLRNLLQDRDYFYFTLLAFNKSAIEFPIDYVVFEVRPVPTKKKTQTEQSIYARYVPDSVNAPVIYPAAMQKLIYSTRKFALRDDEVLRVRIYEKSINSKGRQYEFTISAKRFNKVVKSIK